MQELSLQEALSRNVMALNSTGLVFNPNQITLANDLQSAQAYSCVIVLPPDNKKASGHDGYEITKFAVPQIALPDTTLDSVWKCTKEHYGITAIAALSGAASIPLNKVSIGHRVIGNASVNTNIISAFGTKFFPRAVLPMNAPVARRLAKAAFGTVRIFGIIGRANPFIGLGLAIFDVVSIGKCAYEERHGK